jgi:hypothetical protein
VSDIVVCHVDCLVCKAIMPLGLCNSFAACWGRAARAVVQPTLHIDAIVGWHHTFTPLRGGITHSRHCGVASLRKGEGKPILADTRAMPLILRGGRGMLVLPFLVLFCFTSYHSQRGDYHYFRFAEHFVFRTFCPLLLWFVLAWHAVCNCLHIVWTAVELFWCVWTMLVLPATPSTSSDIHYWRPCEFELLVWILWIIGCSRLDCFSSGH